MATVDKTWVFASDNEGLADNADSAVSVVHDTGGNPGGSLEFLGAATGTGERARKATTGETWETWGAPSGSTVTSLQVISGEYRVWASPLGRTLTLSARVLDSGGTTVHAAGDLLTVTPLSTAAAWQSMSGSSRAVDAGKQASTTDVRFEIQLAMSGTDANLDVGVDNVLVRMTYTAGGGGGTVVKQLSALGVG